MIEHTGPISGVAAFGGKLIATAGYDNRVILWDAVTGAGIARGVHDHLANQCAFSSDGRHLVTASSDYSARIWALPQMQLVALCAGHADDVEMAAFGPDDRAVATASRDGTVRIFSVDGTMQRMLAGHKADVLTVAWADEGRVLVSCSDDGTIKRWDVATGKMLEDIDMHGVETDTIALTPEALIYAGSDDGKITVIGRNSRTEIKAHSAGIKRLTYYAPARRLVSLSYDRTAAFWKVDGEGHLRREGETSLPSIVWPRSCAVLDDERVVFGTFGSRYATCYLANASVEVAGIRPAGGLNAVASLDDTVVSIGDAGILMRDGATHRSLGSLCNFLTPCGSDVLTGGQLGTLFEGMSGHKIHQHRSPLNCATVCQVDGSLVALVGSYTGEVLVFRRNAMGALVFEREVRLHENAIKGLASAGGVIFSVCATGEAAFHRASDLALLQRIPKAHDKIANGCTAIENGARFASIGRDLTLRLWRPDGMEKVVTPHIHSIKCIAAAGPWIVTGAYDGRVATFNVESREWVRTERPTASGISSLTVGPAGFLASSYDGHVYRVGEEISASTFRTERPPRRSFHSVAP